jgi:XapX domain-containing protein
MKTALGLLFGFMIGVICSVAGLPLPATPVLVGVLLVAIPTA